MSMHAYHRLYYHIVWTTKNREAVIIAERQEWMKREIGRNSTVRQGSVHALAVLDNHIHLCVTLPPTATLSGFIGEVKGASSRAYNREHGGEIPLQWQRGYGAMTIRKSDLEIVIPYIENNAERHQTKKGLIPTFEKIEEASDT